MKILIKNGDWAWTLGINETLNERQLFAVMKVTRLDANSVFAFYASFGAFSVEQRFTFASCLQLL